MNTHIDYTKTPGMAAKGAPAPELHPLQDRVFVKKKRSAEKSKGGIILPETSQDGETVEGEVVAVGPGAYQHGTFVPMGIRVGWTVVYFTHAGTKVKAPGGEELLSLMESEVIARVGGEGVK